MTIAENIKRLFDPYFSAPLKAWKVFTDFGEVVSFDEEKVIKQTGSTENYLSFILKGSGGILLWNNNNFVCIDICFEGEFFGDYMSFLTGKISPIEIVTFEPSKLFRISKTNFQKLEKTKYGSNICRSAAEQLFIQKQNQQIEILTKTPTQRYQDFLNFRPNLIQRIPQKFLASYLGITPQSLSRIRRKIINNN